MDDLHGLAFQYVSGCKVHTSIGNAILVFATLLLVGTACASPAPRPRPPAPAERVEPEEVLPLSAAELDEACRSFRAFLTQAEFKRAETLLNDLALREPDRDQEEILRSLRAELRETSFLHHNPLIFTVVSPSTVFAFGDAIPLTFTIFNLADQAVEIPGESAVSWWPGAERRRSCIVGRFVVTDVNALNGTRSSAEWSEMLEFDETWRIPPGSSLGEPFTLSVPGQESLLYRRVDVWAELIPGGLQTGPFDWGMIRILFPMVTLHFFPRERMEIAEAPGRRLEEALESMDAGGILLASMVLEDEDRIREAVDRIMAILPDLSRRDRNTMMTALEWLTGESYGYDLNRWMNWWSGRQDKPAASAGTSVPWLALALFGALPEESADLKEHLDDRYYRRRFAALKRLETLNPPDLASLLNDESPRVRAAAAEALGGKGSESAAQLLMDALEEERDPLVRQRIAQTLAQLKPLPRWERVAPLLEQDALLKKLYVDRALMNILEGILHYEGLPGFYDGQFDALWSVSDEVFDHLVRIARDPDYGYHIRVLAIMALHENKDAPILQALRPLIMDPENEHAREWDEFTTFRITERFIERNRERNLSKFARYSLAKAGMTRFNLAKIDVMRQWLQRHHQEVFKPTAARGGIVDFDFFPTRDFGKKLILDIGYNYQQFDAFDDAERWYKVLIERFTEERDVRMAAEAHYNLGCLYSVTERKALAIEHIRLAIEKGFLDLSWMDRDRDLDNLRNDQEFQSLRNLIIQQPPEEIKDLKVD